MGLDVLVGTPGRIIDHIERGNLDLSHCDLAVLDEADEMLNMGFADDVETILNGLGDANGKKPQCLLFSATTPSWVKEIGKQYQEDVIAIDATGDTGGARVATTVRHIAIQTPPGVESKKDILEDIIAVEISKDMKGVGEESDEESDDDEPFNEIAAAAAARKMQSTNSMQQKIFGKTIVFVETKRMADELVAGGVFKSLTAQVCYQSATINLRANTSLNLFFLSSRHCMATLDRNSVIPRWLHSARGPSMCLLQQMSLQEELIFKMSTLLCNSILLVMSTHTCIVLVEQVAQEIKVCLYCFLGKINSVTSCASNVILAMALNLI